MKKEFLQVGRIVGTHGVRGMLRVEPWCDTADFLKDCRQFETDGGESLSVLQLSPHGNIVLLKAKGIDTVEQAERLRGRILSVHRDTFSLPEGRWFVCDILGSEVFSADGAFLGTLADVLQTGANDVWEITKDGKSYLVPAIESVIVSVDTDSGKIVINPMKGIFDDED